MTDLIPKRRTPVISIIVCVVVVAFVITMAVVVGQMIGTAVNHVAPGYIVQP